MLKIRTSTYLPQAETTVKRRRLELKDVNEEEEPEEPDINEDDVNEDEVNEDDVNDDGVVPVVDTPATNTPADGGSNLSYLFFSASISALSSRKKGVRHLDQWNARAKSVSKRKAAEGLEFAKRLQVLADEQKLSVDKKLKTTNLGTGY
jgi:hypothetical protein